MSNTGSLHFKLTWFVLIFTVFISIFIRLPFRFFDEHVHYMRSIGVSGGQLLSYSEDGNHARYGHDIDKANVSYPDSYIASGSSAISINWLSDKEGGKNKAEDDVYKVNTSAAPYTPVPYIPFALGSKISSLFNLNLRTEIILMRLMGAISSLALIYAAFRVAADRYKWVVLCVSMVPMSLSAFAAISIDGFTLASCLLFAALISRISIEATRKGRVGNKYILALGAVSLLLVASKMPMFLMIALNLATIGIYRKAISKKQKIYTISLIILSAFITLFWLYTVKDVNTGAYWGRDVDTVAQLKYIMGNPLVFLKNLTSSILDFAYINIPYSLYANNTFFQSMPFLIDIVIWIGLFLSPYVYGGQLKLREGAIWLYRLQLATVLLIWVSIFVILYLQFTPIGTPNKIDGVQTRYFIPLLPLLLFTPHRLKLSRFWNKVSITAPYIGVATYLVFIAIQLF